MRDSPGFPSIRVICLNILRCGSQHRFSYSSLPACSSPSTWEWWAFLPILGCWGLSHVHTSGIWGGKGGGYTPSPDGSVRLGLYSLVLLWILKLSHSPDCFDSNSASYCCRVAKDSVASSVSNNESHESFLQQNFQGCATQVVFLSQNIIPWVFRRCFGWWSINDKWLELMCTELGRKGNGQSLSYCKLWSGLSDSTTSEL